MFSSFVFSPWIKKEKKKKKKKKENTQYFYSKTFRFLTTDGDSNPHVVCFATSTFEML